jgi:hypothetical protein
VNIKNFPRCTSKYLKLMVSRKNDHTAEGEVGRLTSTR